MASLSVIISVIGPLSLPEMRTAAAVFFVSASSVLFLDEQIWRQVNPFREVLKYCYKFTYF